MDEPFQALLAYWGEHRIQLRQSEDQRSALTNYVLIVVSGLTGFIVQQQFRPRTLPLCILITGIGLYGAICAAKYHERAQYHLIQARVLTRVLQTQGALPDNRDALDEGRQAHYAKYPRLHRLRLYQLWIGLHIGIAAFGATLAIISVTRIR
jgi:hypothetical protein